MRLLRSKSLVFDIYGAFVRELGGWIAIADLLVLLGDLDVDEQAVRSSVSRFAQRGLLVRESRDGQAGYSLSETALAILEEGDDRIYQRLAPAAIEDGWVLVTFSVPEHLRADRHRLRSRLTWLGYGNFGSGIWIAPRRIIDRTIGVVAGLGLSEHVDIFEGDYRAFDDLNELVRRCWDLDALRSAYRVYLEEFEPMIEKWSNVGLESETCHAFRDYVSALHEWRKLPFLDPGLPSQLLPSDWEGKSAADLFNALRNTLEPSARSYVSSVVSHR